MKTCRKCKNDRDDFQPDGRSKDGLSVECDDCRTVGIGTDERYVRMYIEQRQRCKICNRSAYLSKMVIDSGTETEAIICTTCAGLLKLARKNRRVWDAVTEYLS
ncbi:hypothetical protein LCGC14_0487260 [marine sediment metagenome]|uniref:Uncharacterized protein n=1 Tax=marine sediment metagenome TaxID=412755 RepID=A0A0F9SQV7_9ZZZZ